jgi:methyl-accepting chemotaxis protein
MAKFLVVNRLNRAINAPTPFSGTITAHASKQYDDVAPADVERSLDVQRSLDNGAIQVTRLDHATVPTPVLGDAVPAGTTAELDGRLAQISAQAQQAVEQARQAVASMQQLAHTVTELPPTIMTEVEAYLDGSPKVLQQLRADLQRYVDDKILGVDTKVNMVATDVQKLKEVVAQLQKDLGS